MTRAEQDLTALTKARYDRQASLYDLKNWPVERLGLGRLRKRLWDQVKPGNILEVGVGTGANFPFYPAGAEITGIDLSDRLLEKAVARAEKLNLKVKLMQMDVEKLEFPDNSFDAVVATCVFCSVPDPVQGLREVKRVLKKEGRAFFLEHMRRDTPIAGAIMDLLNPLVVRMMGANINRKTLTNVILAGLEIESVESFFFDIVKLIVARPG